MLCRFCAGKSWTAGMAGAALLLCGFAVAFADEKPQNSAPEKAGDAKKTEKKKEAAKEKDPYAVPDGTPKELAEFITGLQRRRIRSLADYRKKLTALSEAADRILKHKDATGEQKAVASKAALTALAGLARFSRSPEARKQNQEKLLKLARTLQDSKDAGVRDAARGELLKERAGKTSELDKKERQKLVDDAVNYLGSEGGSLRSRFGTAFSVVRQLERAEAREQAADAYSRFGKILAKADDATLKRYAAKMEGAARRVMLPGNPIDIKGTTVDGKPFNWSEYKGKVVLVDFWATWCGPCIAELPNVKKQYQLYHDKGFDIVGISLDRSTSKDRLEKFIKDREIQWTTLYSSDEKASGWDHPMATYYGVLAIPTAMLVDQKGNVVSLNARGEELQKQLRKLLGPPPEKEKKDVPKESGEKKAAEGDKP